MFTRVCHFLFAVAFVPVRCMMLICLDIGDETKEGGDFHSEMEAKLRMNW